MGNTRNVVFRKSDTPSEIPTASQINEGDLAFNMPDKAVYSKFGTEVVNLMKPYETQEFEYLTFEDANYEVGPRQIAWNSEDGTLDIGLNSDAASVLQVGMEVLYRVDNNTGSTIANGTLVMYQGTIGNSGRMRVKPWDGTTPENIMGIATQDIPNGTSGYTTHFGRVRGIDTTGTPYGETWSDGDTIYAAPNGGLTNTIPEAPNTKTSVAVVINSHDQVGTLFVRVTRSSSIDNDDNVFIDNIQDGHALLYNTTNGRFENGYVSSSDVVEGSNLFFTEQRSRDSLSASGDLSYDNTTGNFSVTTYKTSDFNSDFSSKTTDDLTEGSKLFFTEQRSRDSLSASGDLSYDSVSGTFSFSETYSNASEVKAAYESNADTNAFTDTEKSKLSAIENNATADQTKSDIDSLGIDAATLNGKSDQDFDPAGSAAEVERMVNERPDPLLMFFL